MNLPIMKMQSFIRNGKELEKTMNKPTPKVKQSIFRVIKLAGQDRGDKNVEKQKLYGVISSKGSLRQEEKKYSRDILKKAEVTYAPLRVRTSDETQRTRGRKLLEF